MWCILKAGFLLEGVFTWENLHRYEFHSSDDFLILYHVIYMMTGSFHISLFEGTLHVDKIHVWFKIANITQRYPLQSTGRLISQWNVWSFCVYMMLLRDFILEWNSRPSTTTGVNSHQHDILWWYHVNKCRAMRGNCGPSELALAPHWHESCPVSC